MLGAGLIFDYHNLLDKENLNLKTGRNIFVKMRYLFQM